MTRIFPTILAITAAISCASGLRGADQLSATPQASTQPAQIPKLQTVAVSAFECRDLLGDRPWLGEAAADIIAGQLSGQPSLQVLERQAVADLEREAALRTTNTAAAPAGQPLSGVAASFIVGGSYTTAKDLLDVEIRIVRAGSAEALWSSRQSGAVDAYAIVFRKAATAAAAWLASQHAGGSLVDVSLPATLPIAAASAYFRARGAAGHGRHARAVADYLRALERAPKNADAWNGLGESLIQLRMPAAAAIAFRNAVDAAPDHPSAPTMLMRESLCLQQCGRSDEAVAVSLRISREYAGSTPDARLPSIRPVDFAPPVNRLSPLADPRAATGQTPADPHRDALRALRTTGECPATLGQRVKDGVTYPVMLKANEPRELILIPPAGTSIATIVAHMMHDPNRATPQAATMSLQGHAEIDPRDEWRSLDGKGAVRPIVTLTEKESALDVPAGGWGGARVVVTTSTAPLASMSFSVTLRPLLPGTVRIDTGSETWIQLTPKGGAIITTLTPCVLRDLPAGDAQVRAGRSDGASAWMVVPIAIAASGDTLVSWPIRSATTIAAPTPAMVASDAALARLPRNVNGARISDPMRRVEEAIIAGPLAPTPSARVRGPIASVWAPRVGWILAWHEDNGIVLASMADRAHVDRIPVPFGFQSDDLITGLYLGADQRMVLAWKRGEMLQAASTADFLAWSCASMPFPPELAGGAWRAIEIGAKDQIEITADVNRPVTKEALTAALISAARRPGKMPGWTSSGAMRIPALLHGPAATLASTTGQLVIDDQGNVCAGDEWRKVLTDEFGFMANMQANAGALSHMAGHNSPEGPVVLAAEVAGENLVVRLGSPRELDLHMPVISYGPGDGGGVKAVPKTDVRPNPDTGTETVVAATAPGKPSPVAAAPATAMPPANSPDRGSGRGHAAMILVITTGLVAVLSIAWWWLARRLRSRP